MQYEILTCETRDGKKVEPKAHGLADRNLDNLRRLRKATVQAACVDLKDKEYICKVMKWDPDKRITDELSEPEYFAEMAKILFPRAPIAGNEKYIDFKTCRKAQNYFLS